MSWHENLGKGETPPEYLWEDARGLELWWAEVEERREQGLHGGRSRLDTPDADDDEPAGDRHHAPEVVENDLARAFRNG